MLGLWAAQHGSGAGADAGESYMHLSAVHACYVGCRVMLGVFGATARTPAATAAAAVAASSLCSMSLHGVQPRHWCRIQRYAAFRAVCGCATSQPRSMC
jgi:hypothetical protein